MSKYKNKKVEEDGITFDSILENSYYKQLKWLKANKQIKGFEIQPKFVLQKGFKKNGITHRAITYSADFKVFNNDGTVDIIDIKNMPITPTFSIKRKMFEYKYPELSLIVLKYVKKYGGWITVEEYDKQKRLEKKRGK